MPCSCGCCCPRPCTAAESPSPRPLLGSRSESESSSLPPEPSSRKSESDSLLLEPELPPPQTKYEQASLSAHFCLLVWHIGCCEYRFSKLSFMRSPSSSSIRCSTAPRSRSVAASVLPSSLSLSASDVCTPGSAVFRNSFTTLRIASFNSALSANSLIDRHRAPRGRCGRRPTCAHRAPRGRCRRPTCAHEAIRARSRCAAARRRRGVTKPYRVR